MEVEIERIKCAVAQERKIPEEALSRQRGGEERRRRSTWRTSWRGWRAKRSESRSGWSLPGWATSWRRSKAGEILARPVAWRTCAGVSAQNV